MHLLYRVSHLLVGRISFDCECYTVCLILLGLREIGLI